MIYLSLIPKGFGDLSLVVSYSDVVLLNPDKTEAVIFRTHQRLCTLSKPVGVSVAGSMVQCAVKLLV